MTTSSQGNPHTGNIVSIYAVTQALCSVTGNQGYFKGASRPVECVSWCDAILFCNRLSALKGLTPCYILPNRSKAKVVKEVVWDRQKSGYRLLTEAGGNIVPVGVRIPLFKCNADGLHGTGSLAAEKKPVVSVKGPMVWSV